MSGPNPSFPQFQSLPVEIRLKIWSLHHGRIIEIFPVRNGFAARPTSPPALLRVNRESRTHAQRSYDLVDLASIAQFEDRSDAGVPRTDLEKIARRSIMIDWRKDTLFLVEDRNAMLEARTGGFSSITTHSLSRVPALQKAQYFAILARNVRSSEDLCRLLPMLQGITLVGQDESRFTGRRFQLQRYDAESLYFAKAAPDDISKYTVFRYRWSIVRKAQASGIVGAQIRFCDIVQGNGDIYERLKTEDLSLRNRYLHEDFTWTEGDIQWD